ncbi:MAG: hypothetical protein R3E87_10570 [Burkholderiaceae bacterium]
MSRRRTPTASGKRRARRVGPGAQLTRDLIETGVAVPAVVGLRLARMAEPLTVVNWLEFNRMVVEKQVAAMTAAQAMFAETLRLQWQAAMQFWPALALGMPAPMPFSPTTAAGRRAIDAVLRAGVKPVRQRVLANRKRLSGEALRARRTKATGTGTRKRRSG